MWGEVGVDEGKELRDYCCYEWPDRNGGERVGCDEASEGVVDAGVENRKEGTNS